MRERFGDEFLRRFLNPDELALAKNNASIAGLWAAKEAASKALGTGISAECGFYDILLSKSERGAPLIAFSPKILDRFKIKKASLSITHDGDFAIAAVMLQI